MARDEKKEEKVRPTQSGRSSSPLNLAIGSSASWAFSRR